MNPYNLNVISVLYRMASIKLMWFAIFVWKAIKFGYYSILGMNLESMGAYLVCPNHNLGDLIICTHLKGMQSSRIFLPSVVRWVFSRGIPEFQKDTESSPQVL